MQKFKYTAINIQKEKYTGNFIAEDEKDLAIQLSKQNLYLVSCSPYSDNTPSAFFTLGTGKVSLKELTSFCRQYSIMLKSGMTILGGLENLKGQAYSSYFKKILVVIYEDVRSGILLSSALEKHKKVFPDFFRSMCSIGEASGKLDEIFTSLADYFESSSAIKRKVISALSYPLMLLGMTIVIVIAMLVYIIPTFRESLADAEVEITGISEIVFSLSDYVIENWLYFLAIIIVIAGSLFLFGKTKRGVMVYDKLKVTLPIFKNVNISLITARFARAFGLLLSSGMDVSEALDASVVIIGNKDVERRFLKAANDVRQGASLAFSFDKYHLFPDMMLQMIAVGEKTASLDEVLMRSCSFFDGEVETALSAMTSKIQPILLALMGSIMAFLFVAIYSPIISMITII